MLIFLKKEEKFNNWVKILIDLYDKNMRQQKKSK